QFCKLKYSVNIAIKNQIDGTVVITVRHPLSADKKTGIKRGWTLACPPSQHIYRFSINESSVKPFVQYPGTYLTESCYTIVRSEEHTSELQSRENLVCRL